KAAKRRHLAVIPNRVADDGGGFSVDRYGAKAAVVPSLRILHKNLGEGTICRRPLQVVVETNYLHAVE
ncbi:MAG: hypothetical protein QOH35_5273, partial [Acidobacteriaceae bacterium]|nr:hypothetical protein [Acidobacteriaceae bacterium]